jgi:hypothetical protein
MTHLANRKRAAAILCFIRTGPLTPEMRAIRDIATAILLDSNDPNDETVHAAISGQLSRGNLPLITAGGATAWGKPLSSCPDCDTQARPDGPVCEEHHEEQVERVEAERNPFEDTPLATDDDCNNPDAWPDHPDADCHECYLRDASESTAECPDCGRTVRRGQGCCSTDGMDDDQPSDADGRL